jgi:hypothetical protein
MTPSQQSRLADRETGVPELYGALQSLVGEVAQLPENGAGTIQGQALNRAYVVACAVLARCEDRQ